MPSVRFGLMEAFTTPLSSCHRPWFPTCRTDTEFLPADSCLQGVRRRIALPFNSEP